MNNALLTREAEQLLGPRGAPTAGPEEVRPPAGNRRSGPSPIRPRGWSTLTRGRAIKLAGAALLGGVLTEPWVMNFGGVEVGDSLQRTVEITNNRGRTMSLELVDDCFEFGAFPGFDPKVRIADGSTVEVPIRFTPALEDAYDGELEIIDAQDPAIVFKVVDLLGEGVEHL